MRIVNEGFEGTGYEGTWVETVSGGNTLDEDSTTVPCFGTQSLKAITTSIAAPSAFAKRTFGNENSVYIRAWIYISQNGLTGVSEIANILDIRDSAETSIARIQLKNNAGLFQARFIYYSDGGEIATSGVVVAINTWYLMEFSYNINTMKWSWYLNNIVKGIGNLVGTVLIPNRLVTGIVNYTGAAQSIAHIDNITVDTEHYSSIIDSFDPIIIEVASAAILFSSRLYIKSIRWVGGTTAGHTAVIQDQKGNVIWASEASGANYVESEIIEQWIDGLIVPTLASGKIYIQIG